MAVSLVKKGYPLYPTTEGQNSEELSCHASGCTVVYVLGYSDGEKYSRLEALRKQAQSAVDSSHAEQHPNVLTL